MLFLCFDAAKVILFCNMQAKSDVFFCFCIDFIRNNKRNGPNIHVIYLLGPIFMAAMLHLLMCCGVRRIISPSFLFKKNDVSLPQQTKLTKSWKILAN